MNRYDALAVSIIAVLALVIVSALTVGVFDAARFMIRVPILFIFSALAAFPSPIFLAAAFLDLRGESPSRQNLAFQVGFASAALLCALPLVVVHCLPNCSPSKRDVALAALGLAAGAGISAGAACFYLWRWLVRGR